MPSDLPHIRRRTFLGGLTAAGASLGAGLHLPGCERREGRGPPPDAPSIPAEAFQLGVASGDPLHDRVILWTRLAPEPLEGGGMPEVDVPVIWEVFADEALTDLVADGWAWALPDFAHAVHADATGLSPNTRYWYRFRVGDQQTSPVGRTRTLPQPDAQPERLRVALASCQKYRDGFFTAYAHLARADVDLVLHLGDYIYESGGDTDVPGRLPLDTERVTDLPGFRERYSAYRLDPDLQAAHAAHPWIAVWDDHEVSNNYADLTLSERRRDDGDPKVIRAAGYQAWYEHMPIRLERPEDPLHMPIYRAFRYGRLATLAMLDTRQYRDPQPCNDQPGLACTEIFQPGRTILGNDQRAWIREVLEASEAHWNLIGQQVMFSPALLEANFVNPDQWDGYLDDRRLLLDLFGRPEVRSPLVLSGDVHAAGFFRLHADQLDANSETVAMEVLTTSIASGGDGADGIAQFAQFAEDLSDNVHYFDATRRGYAVCDLTTERCEVTFYAVTTVVQPTADLYVAARYTIDAGSLEMEELEREPLD